MCVGDGWGMEIGGGGWGMEIGERGKVYFFFEEDGL